MASKTKHKPAPAKKKPTKKAAKKAPAKKKPTKKAAKTKPAKKKAAPAQRKAAKKVANKKAPAKKAASKSTTTAKAASKSTTTAKSASKSTTAKPASTVASKSTATASKPAVAKSASKATTTIVQHVFIQATPQQVYDALVEPSIAAQIVGGECTGDAVVGGAFMQWNDYIHGTHLELVRGERIVQEWTTTEWPKGAAPSRLELQLSGTGGGTELTMTHSSVPSEQAEDYRQGWIDYYWTPMRAHFGG